MRGLVSGLVAGGVALLGAGVAHAQDNDAAMTCVYDTLKAGQHHDVVAEVFLYTEVSEERIQQAILIAQDAKKACVEKFSYAPGQIESAGDYGVYGVSVDYLSGGLLRSGVSAAAIKDVRSVYETLSDADVDTLFDHEWRSEVAFHDRLKAQVTGIGIPDNEEQVEMALDMLEITAFAEEAMRVFERANAPVDVLAN